MLNLAYRDRSIIVERYKYSQRPIIKDMECGPITTGKYLPVVRYESLYYSKQVTDKPYLGKFYYYEPESSFGLNLGNYLLAANKYQAIRYLEQKLLGNFDEIELLQNGIVPTLLSLYYLLLVVDVKYSNVLLSIPDTPPTSGGLSLKQQHNDLTNYIQQCLLTRGDVWKETFLQRLTKTRQELTTIMHKEDEIDNYQIEVISVLNYNILGEPYVKQASFIENYNGNLFGKSDYLDQPLVQLARRFGYDTIILQREIGEYNIVTEVLDCRNLGVVNISEISANQTKYRYPLIWTPDKGLL